MNPLSMSNILKSITVASSEYGATVTTRYTNTTAENLLAKLHLPIIGSKNGSHFLRTALKTRDRKCLPRINENTESMARLLVIDGDSRIDSNGEILEGAPDPTVISQILRNNEIGHVLYGSYSHYTGMKGNRYRIILVTAIFYTKAQLTPTLDNVFSFINKNLDDELLMNVNENNTWAQPWYFPRKPKNCSTDTLYIEYLEGNAVEVVNPIISPTPKCIEKPVSILDNNTKSRFVFHKEGEISPIHAFNEQYPLSKLLPYYGYKKVHETKDGENVYFGRNEHQLRHGSEQ